MHVSIIFRLVVFTVERARPFNSFDRPEDYPFTEHGMAINKNVTRINFQS